jgi:hypothetical protein
LKFILKSSPFLKFSWENDTEYFHCEVTSEGRDDRPIGGTISLETKRKAESSSSASVLGNSGNHFQVRQTLVITEGWRQVKSVIETKLTSVIA